MKITMMHSAKFKKSTFHLYGLGRKNKTAKSIRHGKYESNSYVNEKM